MSHAAALGCVAIGFVALVGWALDLPALKRVHGSYDAMKANAAVGRWRAHGLS